MKNTVAKVLKIFAIVNAACGLLLGLYWGVESDSPIILDICICFIAISIVASFGIYAFGEVVQLLQDIKDGTNKTAHTIQVQAASNSSNDDQLPRI